MQNFSLMLPVDFDEYEWEVVSKGFFSEATLAVVDRRYRLSFYDSMRLKQDIEGDLERDSMFLEKNLIVIESVTRSNMEKAVDLIVSSGRVDSLAFE